MTRREWLEVGGISLLGLCGSMLRAGVPSPAQAAETPLLGRAKSCILLYLYGAPSQLETFDPKPKAPLEVRGEFGVAESNVPGLWVCDRLPKMSRVMDKVTLLRSVTHPYPIHGVAFATTSNPRMELAMELSPRDAGHWPFIGSVVDYVDERSSQGIPPSLPRNLFLPWAFSTRRVGEVARAGPYGGFLGPAYDPVAAEFVGKGTVKARKTLTDKVWNDFEPYRGIEPSGRFELGATTDLNPSLTLDRLDRRRSLLTQIEEAQPLADWAAARPGVDRERAQAFELVRSRAMREAFDLGLENEATRALYGMTLFGQSALTARRLVEAGGRFVSVMWDEYGLAGTGWDTHWDHYPRMKDELLPGLDDAVSGLLIDLDQRGLLDETLVVVLSEHGRTPRLQNVAGGGRDHWSRCYSVVMAGGGIARGKVIGRSDAIASDPVERPVSPKDILATIYHLLGIPLDTMLSDRQGRPMPIAPGANVIEEALA